MDVLNTRVHCELRLLTVKHFSSAPFRGMFKEMQMLQNVLPTKRLVLFIGIRKKRSAQNTYIF